jgi:hypothetical protein
MAYWTISFKTRTGSDVDIFIAGKSGNTNEALTPAANPLVTQEDGDEDLFVPVKTQTGYVNVVTDNVGLIRSIIPITGGSRSVEVYVAHDLVWKGYVQPQMLSFDLWSGKQELSIPIECPLAALRHKTFATSEKFLTVAQLMSMLMSDYDNVVVQGTFPAVSGTGGSAEYASASWLAKKIYTSLFTKEENTYLDVLQKLCTFFGWTCRSGVFDDFSVVQDVELTAYFLQNRNTDYVGRRDLYLIPYRNLSDATVFGTKLTGFYEQYMPTDHLADNQAELIMTEGIKTATVECPVEDFNMRVDVIDDDFKQSQWQELKTETTTSPCGYPTYYWEQIQETHGDWSFDGYNVNRNIWKDGSEDVKDWVYYVRVNRTAKTDEQHIVPGESGSPEVDYYKVLTWYEGFLTITKQSAVQFEKGGVLTINFGLGIANYKTEATVHFYLRVINGQDVWKYDPNTQTWDSQGNDVECITEDNSFKAVIPKEMPGGGNMTGRLQIYIFRVDDDLLINQITFDYRVKEGQAFDSGITTVQHKASSDVDFSNDVSFDSALCVKEALLASGANILLNSDGSQCEGVVDSPSPYATPYNPLQRLVDECATEGKRVGELLNLNVRSEHFTNTVNPISIFEVAALDHDMYYPVRIDRNWRDDVLMMKLLKRRYNEQY